MKINFGWQMLVVLIVVGVALYVFVKGKAAATKLVMETLNPASDQNIVYSGVNTVVQKITDNKDATLGTAAYDSIHDECGNLKWPWQASSPCTFRGTSADNIRVGINPPKTVFKTFGTSSGE